MTYLHLAVVLLLFCNMLTKQREFLRKQKWVLRLLYFLSAWFSIHVIVITIDGLQDNEPTTGIAIVLGNRVYADGSLATWTKGRVDKALQLYTQQQVQKIFVSGGISVENNYPEGKAMKAYLVSKGVPDSAVMEDNEGANTYLSAVNFIKWNKDQKYSSVVVVSQFYHITRSKYILRKAGYEGEIYSASSDVYNWKDIIGTIREVPAFYKYLLFY